MSARLFPGFGSGKGVFEGFYTVKAVGSAGRSDLEFGDKVLLPPVRARATRVHREAASPIIWTCSTGLQLCFPSSLRLSLHLAQSAFKEVSRLRLPFPLTFQVFNDKANKAAAIPTRTGAIAGSVVLPEQFCGVLEFSAPEGCAYLPQWMMANLKLRDGAQARCASILDVRIGGAKLCRAFPSCSSSRTSLFWSCWRLHFCFPRLPGAAHACIWAASLCRFGGTSERPEIFDIRVISASYFFCGGTLFYSLLTSPPH